MTTAIRIETVDVSLHDQVYSVRQIGHYTYTEVSNPEAYFDVRFFDPCTTADFVVAQVEPVYYFVDLSGSGEILTVQIPYQSDTVQEQYGTPGTESVCRVRNTDVTDANGALLRGVATYYEVDALNMFIDVYTGDVLEAGENKLYFDVRMVYYNHELIFDVDFVIYSFNQPNLNSESVER